MKDELIMAKKKLVEHMNFALADSGILEIDHIGAGVGIFLYSPEHKIAVGLHVLDTSFPGRNPQNPTRYGNTAIRYGLDMLNKRKVEPPLDVFIAGGAEMDEMPEEANVGPKIVLIVKDALSKENLDIKLEDTGGSKIRKMRFDLDKKKVEVI